MPAAAMDELYDYDPGVPRRHPEIGEDHRHGRRQRRQTKFSYGVLRVLHETGYDMIPVNPNPRVTEIRGIKVYPSLEAIDRPVDMVEVFRPKEELYGIAEQAIAIGAKVLWGQIGVHDDRAAKLAEDAGLKVVMNRCPKIELFRPFWKPRLDLPI